MPQRDIENQLSNALGLNDFNFIEVGTYTMSEIYQKVKEHYPQLCDDDFQCRDCHNTKHSDPEWHHIVRARMQISKARNLRISNLARNSYAFS